MEIELRIMKRRASFLLSVVGLYCTMWLLTQLVGTVRVREDVFGAMILPGDLRDFEDVTHSDRPLKTDAKVYWCRAVAYAPFVIHVDYGWTAGPLTGRGGSAVYVWLLKSTVRVYQIWCWDA
jgi:hypothetical protein